MPFAASKPCDSAASCERVGGVLQIGGLLPGNPPCWSKPRERCIAIRVALFGNETFGEHPGQRGDVSSVFTELVLVDRDFAHRHRAHRGDLVPEASMTDCRY